MGRVESFPIHPMPPADQVKGLRRYLDFIAAQDFTPYRDLAYTMLAGELALTDSGLEYDRDSNTIGMIQAFETPGSESLVNALLGLRPPEDPAEGPPRVYEQLAPLFYASQPFIYVFLAAKALGLHGLSTSVHNACTSGAFAIEIAAQHIRSGNADVMLVVGGEAFDTGVRMEWFRRLNVYATDGKCCPFVGDSKGLCVGEGAGAIVLESADHAERRGARVYARYLGGALACQGWKQTIPDVRTSRLRDVIEEAMRRAGVKPGDVDLIVPHAAGTALSDRYEGACLTQAGFAKDGSAMVTAFKPYVGHMLAASAVIESVCALLALHHDTIPATLFSDPAKVKLDLPFCTERTQRPLRTLLKLSTGFTGHDAALIFSK